METDHFESLKTLIKDEHFETLKSLIVASESNLSNQIAANGRDMRNIEKRVGDLETDVESLQLINAKKSGGDKVRQTFWGMLWATLGGGTVAIITFVGSYFSGAGLHH